MLPYGVFVLGAAAAVGAGDAGTAAARAGAAAAPALATLDGQDDRPPLVTAALGGGDGPRFFLAGAASDARPSPALTPGAALDPWLAEAVTVLRCALPVAGGPGGAAEAEAELCGDEGGGTVFAAVEGDDGARPAGRPTLLAAGVQPPAGTPTSPALVSPYVRGAPPPGSPSPPPAPTAA